MLRGLGGLGVVALLDCGGTGATSGGPTDAGRHEGRDGGGADASPGAYGSEGGNASGLDATGADATSGGGSVDAQNDVDADAMTPTQDGAACVLEPTLTKGPYWIDERLERADIRTDTNGVATPNPRPGLPLSLRITVLAYGPGGCSPLAGAQVDVWQCDASGLYSDTAALGTAGENFLRGFQRTDANGLATFTTIYPGWYSGRCVHAHVKVRLFDMASNVTTEATTQIFFDDSITRTVCTTAPPYTTRGAPDTSNAMDAFYGNHTELLLNLQGDAASGYTGSVRLGVPIGTISTG